MSSILTIFARLFGGRSLASAALLAAFAVLSFAPPTALAQGTGTIVGRVLDQATGQYLNNAVVSVEGTNLTALSEAGGYFRLLNVPAGSVRISVWYTGLETATVTAIADSGRTTDQGEIALKKSEGEGEIIALTEFVVSGEREGNAKAIMDQREAINMKTVIASDAMGNVSEGNVGEFLKLMPGVAIDYTEADARQVRIRGMDPKYAVVLMDGMPVASASSSDIGQARRFEFEQLSIASIETVEMSKTPTPADNASAVAGVVNLRSKGAFDRKGRRITVETSASVNSLSWFRSTPGPRDTETHKIMPNYKVEFSDVFMDGKLGVIAGYNYSKTFAEQKAVTVNYQWDRVIANNETEVPRVTSFALRDSPKPTTRENVNVRFDYKINPDMFAFARFDYNTYAAQFYSRDLQFNFGNPYNSPDPDGTGSGVAGPVDPNIEYSLSSQTSPPTTGSAQYHAGGGATNKHGNTRTLTGGFSYTRGSFRADVSGQYSQATNLYEDLPYGFFWGMGTNSLSGMQLRWNRNGPSDPGLNITQLAGPDWRNLANFTITNPTTMLRQTKDQRWTTKADFTYSANLAEIPVKFRFGLSRNERVLDLNRRLNNAGYTFLGPDGVAGGADSNAALYAEPNYRMNFKWGGNIDGATNIDRFALARLYAEHPEYFVKPDYTTAEVRTTFQNAYDFEETVEGLYLQPIFRFNNMTVAPGMRYERTNTGGMGPTDIGDREARRRLTGSPTGTVNTNSLDYIEARYRDRVSGKKEYSNAFGYLHLTYKLNEQWMLRASFHQGITRPDVSNLVPGISGINETSIPPRITISNTDLRPEMSKNYNFSVEHYFEPAGSVTLTLFNSRIEDLQRRVYEDLGDDGYLGDPQYAGYRATSWYNVASGEVRGVELSYQQQLTFLPESLRGLGVFGNVTKLSFDDWLNFSGSARHTANGGISFSRRGLSMRFNTNYTGHKAFSSSVTGADGLSQASPYPADGSNNAGITGYEKERMLCDFNIEYKFMKKYTAFVYGRNIFNEPYVSYRFRPDIVNRWAQFGSLWTIGVRANF